MTSFGRQPQDDDLDGLARDLMEFGTMPEELDRLAAVSRSRYQQFVEQGTDAFAGLCRHPKLVGADEPRPATPDIVELAA